MIEKISIKNFRSIKDIELNLDSNYIVLTGENNSGKSNILRAIIGSRGNSPNTIINNFEKDILHEVDNSEIIIEPFKDNAIYLYLHMRETPSIWDEILRQNLYKQLLAMNTDKNNFPMSEWRSNMVGYDQDPNISNDKDGIVTPLKHKGYGFQAMHIYALLPLIAKSLADLGYDFICCIDEPETSLHPKKQEELNQQFLKWTKKYNNLSLYIVTHSYHFLNFNNPSSNFLVYKDDDDKETKVKRCSTDNIQPFKEICEALGLPYPEDIYSQLHNTTKNSIFIVEGKTDKAHVENCIKLFSNELQGLFNTWEIIPAEGVSKVKSLGSACCKLRKNIKGFVDNDSDGLANKPEYLSILPIEGNIEIFTNKPKDFETEELKSKWEEVSSDRGNKKYHTDYTNLEKELWKVYLTQLVDSDTEKAKRNYNALKDFLINIFQNS